LTTAVFHKTILECLPDWEACDLLLLLLLVLVLLLAKVIAGVLTLPGLTAVAVCADSNESLHTKSKRTSSAPSRANSYVTPEGCCSPAVARCRQHAQATTCTRDQGALVVAGGTQDAYTCKPWGWLRVGMEEARVDSAQVTPVLQVSLLHGLTLHGVHVVASRAVDTQHVVEEPL